MVAIKWSSDTHAPAAKTGKEDKMSCFEGIDLNRLFDSSSAYRTSDLKNDVTDELISRAEETMGYRLPESYKELLRFRNGGSINDELEESWLTEIYGIADDPANFNGLEAMYDNWRNEWEYPDIGIPFGETASAGHDMYYMDCRITDENGEPRIVRIDNEMGNEIFFIANSLPEFIKMILSDEPIDEIFTGERDADEEDQPEIPQKKEEKKSFFGKLFGR